jgi:hypothetical protein
MSRPVLDIIVGGLSIVRLEQSGNEECQKTVAGPCLGFSGTKFVSSVEEAHVCDDGFIIQVDTGP